MENITPINIRFKFKKIGKLQYISHLDLVRTMHKIVIRSKLPIWYTEGFNPKPKMVFAAPLSIGTESYTEFMDLRLNEMIDPNVALTALNANMTDELTVLEAYYPETKLTDLKWLSYTVTLNVANGSDELARKCENVLNCDKLMILKQTKSGESVVDIKPLVRSATASFGNDSVKINCVLSADASAFLNPEYIVKYLKKEIGVLCSDNLVSESYSIVREKAFKSDMSEYR